MSAGPSGLEGFAGPVFALSFGYTESMTAVPLGEARDRLSEYVSEVERTHERVTITRHGHPAAVLISADDLAAIEETLEILGTPGAAEAIREGQADADVGRFVDNDEVKSRYGVAWASTTRSGSPLAQSATCSDCRRRSLLLLSLIHISEPTRRTPISYAVFCLKK